MNLHLTHLHLHHNNIVWVLLQNNHIQHRLNHCHYIHHSNPPHHHNLGMGHYNQLTNSQEYHLNKILFQYWESHTHQYQSLHNKSRLLVQNIHIPSHQSHLHHRCHNHHRNYQNNWDTHHHHLEPNFPIGHLNKIQLNHQIQDYHHQHHTNILMQQD